MTLTPEPQVTTSFQNTCSIATKLLDALIEMGVQEFCVCPSARNASVVYPLSKHPEIQVHYWSEERSAAFFSIGRIQATQKPVAVIVTSGTAAAELLPATMEAFYTATPLILITADRPKRFRGSGAPQSAEQVHLFNSYAHNFFDFEDHDPIDLSTWKAQGPMHINLCLEEPIDSICQAATLAATLPQNGFKKAPITYRPSSSFSTFIHSIKCPLVIVSGIKQEQQNAVISFLNHLNAPAYLEGNSGMRENPNISHLQIRCIDKTWKLSSKHNYQIDGILRIGAVPTARIWRDIEESYAHLPVFSISDSPFAGLSFGEKPETPLIDFCRWAKNESIPNFNSFANWKEADLKAHDYLNSLLDEEPLSEPSLIRALSEKITKHANIYLGNSLPIRQWDLAATSDNRFYNISSSRGLNGIDGQLATFLGFSRAESDNWAILGDLTLLYDMVAPWITPQLSERQLNVVVVNNNGGQIFSRMFKNPVFLNKHQLSFKPFADFWGWDFEKWGVIPSKKNLSSKPRLIELCPNQRATERFWQSWESYSP